MKCLYMCMCEYFFVFYKAICYIVSYYVYDCNTCYLLIHVDLPQGMWYVSLYVLGRLLILPE